MRRRSNDLTKAIFRLRGLYKLAATSLQAMIRVVGFKAQSTGTTDVGGPFSFPIHAVPAGAKVFSIGAKSGCTDPKRILTNSLTRKVEPAGLNLC